MSEQYNFLLSPDYQVIVSKQVLKRHKLIMTIQCDAADAELIRKAMQNASNTTIELFSEPEDKLNLS